MRTLRVPSDSASCPPAYALAVAPVRVKATVNERVSPAGTVSDDGVTTTLKPLMPVTDGV